MYRQVGEEIKHVLESAWMPIILILGARQVGKTTLAESLVPASDQVRFNFDLLEDAARFSRQGKDELALFSRRYQDKTIIIDEVQKKPEATAVIKHLYDTYKMRFILTGSSEVKIRRGLGDSLAGRIHEVHLYPLTLSEINIQSGLSFKTVNEYNSYDQNQQNLLRALVYGSLPQIQNIEPAEYETYLTDYVNTVLSKDILELGHTRKTTQVYTLAKHLALQIGQLVNFNELAKNTELSRVTVAGLIDTFEQMGLVVRAKPISTNERESISKATKIYFVDLGVRNALIGNFSAFNGRLDAGQLLENAVFMGIKRQLEYGGNRGRYELGFFRSPHGAEVDIVKKVGGKEELLEVKLSRPTRKLNKGVELVTLETAQKYLY